MGINIEEIQKCENFSIKDFKLIEEIELYYKETGVDLRMKICPFTIFKMKYPEPKSNSSISESYNNITSNEDML